LSKAKQLVADAIAVISGEAMSGDFAPDFSIA
jgi:hypothetical protein